MHMCMCVHMGQYSLACPEPQPRLHDMVDDWCTLIASIYNEAQSAKLGGCRNINITVPIQHPWFRCVSLHHNEVNGLQCTVETPTTGGNDDSFDVDHLHILPDVRARNIKLCSSHQSPHVVEVVVMMHGGWWRWTWAHLWMVMCTSCWCAPYPYVLGQCYISGR